MNRETEIIPVREIREIKEMKAETAPVAVEKIPNARALSCF